MGKVTEFTFGPLREFLSMEAPVGPDLALAALRETHIPSL